MGNVHPFIHPGVNTLFCLEEWRGKQRILPQGDNFTLRGQNSPLGDNFKELASGLPNGMFAYQKYQVVLVNLGGPWKGKFLVPICMYLRAIMVYLPILQQFGTFNDHLSPW
jgi:hypothetical protein